MDNAQEISESGGIMGANFSVLVCFPKVLLHFAIVMQESGEIDFLYALQLGNLRSFFRTLRMYLAYPRNR